MNPIRMPSTNRVLGAPLDWDEAKHGICQGLPVTIDGDHFYSWWSLSWAERIRVLFGKPLRLCILSRSHPPVALEITAK